MAPDELPRQPGEDDELPDDFGSRIGDTLTFGTGSYIRTISADEARRQSPHASSPTLAPATSTRRWRSPRAT